MDTRRSWRLLVLLLALVALAAACGDSDDDTTEAGAEGESSETTAAESSDTTAAESSDTTAAGDAAALPDLGGRTVTVAVENAYLPFNYIDAETNEPAGWDYDAIDEMCRRLNCVPDYQTFAWEPMIQAVADGQFDMAADGITITDERAQVVDFSDGYINVDQRLMVRLDEDRFEDADALAADESLTIGTQTGTTNYDVAVELVGQDRVVAFEQFGFAVQALISGDVDAVIMDESAGQGYVGENADAVKLVGPSLSSDQLGFIFPKGSDLVEPFNLVIAQMKADGTMEALGQQYFSGAFTITYDDIGDPTATTTTP
jgi:polar amino acid transport system substrate-binding protein